MDSFDSLRETEMDEFSELLEHMPAIRVLRCRACRYALVPAQVKAHLAQSHKTIGKKQRREISSIAESLPQVAHDPGQVLYPSPSADPVEGFPVWHDGVRCTWQDEHGQQCDFVCRTVFPMQQHCKIAHGWTNDQKRGGNKKMQQKQSPNRLWVSSISCQQFFRVPGWKKYFEVAAVESTVAMQTGQDGRDAFFRAQEDGISKMRSDEAERANTVQGFDDHRSTVVPWLRETGIAEHICGLSKGDIASAISLPSGDQEPLLQTVLDAFDAALHEAHSRCFDGPDCMLTWPCRVVLGRFQSSQVEMVGKTRGFDPYKEAATLKTYFRTAKQAVAYFARVAVAEEYHFRTDRERAGFVPEDVLEPTDEQLSAWNEIRRLAQRENSEDRTNEEAILKRSVIDMFMLLVCHETGARRYASPLLSYCAMLSIKSSTASWMEAGNFNSHLSAVIWVAQLLIFYSSAHAEQRGEGSTLSLVKQCCEKYLQQATETPMGEILRWRLLLFKISKDSVSDHQAEWDETEEVVTFEGTKLHMSQIPTLLLSEYNGCRQLLRNELMLGITGLPRMHAYALKDNASIETFDWSFTQHPENARLMKDRDKALLMAIERSENLCQLFTEESHEQPARLQWRENAIASYEASVQAFLRQLCVLIHVSSGQPLRENEFFSMTLRNTQRRRSITLRHDKVMIHVKYHKGQQQTGRYKDNIRFLAQPIGDLLLDYAVFVLPLRQIFRRQSLPKATLSAFLWEKGGNVWSANQLTRCLEEASIRAKIPRLHVSNWRQMTVAIVKTKFAGDIACFEPDDDDEDAEEIEDNIRIMTRQRNHKTRTVNRAYANQTGATFGNVWDGLVRMGLRASTLWQDYWGVETILKHRRPPEDHLDGRLTKRIALGVFTPRRLWSAEFLLQALRNMMRNEHLAWKSAEQEQALLLIMSWTDQVVAVLPTGAGKSLLFMLPCTLPDARVTVVVVPLVSLRMDLLRRVGQLGIHHLVWLPSERREASLILVSVEAASTKDFFGYAQRLIAQQRLDRIVIDECHLTVTAVDYRPSVVELTVLRSLRTQFVYLTATLPPYMQTEFEERNYLHRPKIVRKSTNRPNILYMVRKAESGRGGILEQAATEARDAWQCNSLFDHSRDKIILYSRTREEAKGLSELLRCECYTAESSPEEKVSTLSRWIDHAECPYIVATTALAEGFDYPHVRLVINVNEPDSLVIFSQESGRAGRDGQIAYSMVLLPPNWEAQLSHSTSDIATVHVRYDSSLRKLRDKHAVHRYLLAEQCFRTSLTEALDEDKDRTWCMAEDVPCDVCKVAHRDVIGPRADVRSGSAPLGLDLIRQESLRNQLELSHYRESLAAVRGTCVLCRALSERWDHKFSTCSRRHDVLGERAKARQRHEERGRRWLTPYTACYWCLNPQSVCQRAENSKDRKERCCMDGDVVLPLCYGVFQAANGVSWVKECFGREFAGTERYFDWLGEETLFGGGKAVQGVRVAAKMLSLMVESSSVE